MELGIKLKILKGVIKDMKFIDKYESVDLNTVAQIQKLFGFSYNFAKI